MTPAAVVAAARGWLDTRWLHQGRVRGVGVDCVGLVIGVARELALLPAARLDAIEAQVGGYGRAPDGRLRPLLAQHLVRADLARPQPGDVLLLRFETQPQHVGIVGELNGVPTLIHAAAQFRRVVEHRMAPPWTDRAVEAFCFPGVMHV